MPILGSNSRSNIRSLIYQLVVKSQAYRHDYSVGKSQVYQRNQYRNSRHSGAIGLSMVCGSTVLAQGQFRRQIGTESCHRVGSQAYQLQQLSGLAAADTGSSFFVLVAGASGGSDSGQAYSLPISRSVNRRRTGTIIRSIDRRCIRTIIRLVDCKRTGMIIRSVDRRCISAISIVIAGIAALSVCQ